MTVLGPWSAVSLPFSFSPGETDMDIITGAVRSVLVDLLDGVRARLIPTSGAERVVAFRELVRNGRFEKPVIENNYWSRKFDPSTSGGWIDDSPDRYSHTRIDGWGAFRSRQYASLAQNSISQVLDTTGLVGETLDVSMYFHGSVSVTIGGTRHVPVWNPDTYDGSGYSRSAFTYTVRPEDVPRLTLRITGESPEEFVESGGMKYPYIQDAVDNVSVLAWKGPAGSAALMTIPGKDEPVLVRRVP